MNKKVRIVVLILIVVGLIIGLMIWAGNRKQAPEELSVLVTEAPASPAPTNVVTTSATTNATAEAQTPAPTAEQTTIPDSTPTPEPVTIQVEYDDSAVKEEDITVANAESVMIDNNGHAIIKTNDGKNIDGGYVGNTIPEEMHMVAFVNQDNKILKVEMVKHGEDATPPTNFGMQGYEFFKWIGNYENVVADTVVVATYVPVGSYYTVTFCDFDEQVLRIEKVAAGENAHGPTQTPVREGYVFVGWDQSIEIIKHDLKVTAKYAAETDSAFAVDSVLVHAGEKQADVAICVINNPGLCAAKLKVCFDPSLVMIAYKIDAEERGGTSIGPETIPATDSVIFLWYKYDGDISDDFTFVTMTFDVESLEKGQYCISIQYDEDDVINIHDDNVFFETISGSIYVE